MSPAPLVALLLLASGASALETRPVVVSRWEPRCILHAVAVDMADVIGRYRGPEFEGRLRAAASAQDLPKVRPQSLTPIQEFRDALARQYAEGRSGAVQLRPETAEFTNMYALASNELFVIDEAGFYERLGGGRSIEDSLAHEYVHYIQVRYYGYSAEDLGRDHSAEAMAVEYQQYFRARYVKTGQAPPCP